MQWNDVHLELSLFTLGLLKVRQIWHFRRLNQLPDGPNRKANHYWKIKMYWKPLADTEMVWKHWKSLTFQCLSMIFKTCQYFPMVVNALWFFNSGSYLGPNCRILNQFWRINEQKCMKTLYRLRMTMSFSHNSKKTIENPQTVSLTSHRNRLEFLLQVIYNNIDVWGIIIKFFGILSINRVVSKLDFILYKSIQINAFARLWCWKISQSEMTTQNFFVVTIEMVIFIC